MTPTLAPTLAPSSIPPLLACLAARTGATPRPEGLAHVPAAAPVPPGDLRSWVDQEFEEYFFE